MGQTLVASAVTEHQRRSAATRDGVTALLHHPHDPLLSPRLNGLGGGEPVEGVAVSLSQRVGHGGGELDGVYGGHGQPSRTPAASASSSTAMVLGGSNGWGEGMAGPGWLGRALGAPARDTHNRVTATCPTTHPLRRHVGACPPAPALSGRPSAGPP
ncbi:MAG: hypothetical protein ACLQIJ_22385 [Polyangia bacterium]